MFENELKKKINRGEPAIGSWIAFSDPYAVEVMGEAGFDWLVIDTEHCAIGPESLRNILVALKGSKSVPVVRLMNNNPDYFKMALDLGARGVIVPMVQSVEEARLAVNSCRYPPVGIRGNGPVRASNYFIHYDEYMKEANEETLLVAQIETIQTLMNLDGILAISEIDAIFIGTGDLSTSMNLCDQLDHPEVQQVIERIIAAAKQAQKPFGTITGTPEDLVSYVKRGATLMTVNGDLGFLIQGAFECQKQTRALIGSLDQLKNK